MKWGKVSEEERKLTSCSFDTSAAAIVLGDIGYISFHYGHPYAILERFTRIKILKPEGRALANIRIPYYAGEQIEKVEEIKAQTINFDETGAKEIRKISKKEIFRVSSSRKWEEVRFALPKVRVGSIIEYRYRYLTKNIIFLNAWSFQREIPTLHSKIATEIPSDLEYIVLLNGNRLLEKYQEEFGESWYLDNLPSLKKEPFVHNSNDYAEKIRFQLSGFDRRKEEILPYEEIVDFLTSWEMLGLELMQDHTYRDYISRLGKLETIIKRIDRDMMELPAGAKIKKIYNYIQSQYIWDYSFSIFPNIKFTDLQQLKSGNSAALNLLFTALAREAGLESLPVIISTRKHGRIEKSYSLLSQFNHLIAMVVEGKDTSYIDTANKQYPHYILPLWDRVNEGLAIKKKGTEWVKIVDPEKKAILKTSILGNLSPSGKIDLKCNRFYNDYFVVDALRKKETPILKTFDYGAGFLETKLSDHRFVLKGEDLEEKFEIEAAIQSLNGKMIAFQPVFIEGFDKNPYQQRQRVYPIENAFKRQQIFQAIYRIPNEYTPESIPGSLELKLPNDYMNFKYVVNQKEGKIFFKVVVSYNYDRIPSCYYEALQQFYDRVIAKLKEKVLLAR